MILRRKQLSDWIAFALLCIPTAFLLLFTFGEVFSGDWSGLSHLMQLLPIVLLGILAVKKPSWAGVLLMGMSGVLGVLYVLKAPFELRTIVMVELSLFIPPFFAGMLLYFSNQNN